MAGRALPAQGRAGSARAGDRQQRRGGRCAEARPGRRVLARVLHDPTTLAANLPSAGPPGSVAAAADGSIAAFVPARRALSWQLTDPQGVAVVRERYWLTFQPGEVRVCGSCHGLSELDQAGAGQPQNTPQALVERINGFMAEETFSGIRKRKGQAVTYDLRALVLAIHHEAQPEPGWHRLTMLLRSEPNATGRPDAVLKALALDDKLARIDRLGCTFAESA